MKAESIPHTAAALPHGFSARGVVEDDLDATVALYNRWSQHFIHRDEVQIPQVILNEWQSGFLDMDRDIRVVFAPDGRMVGYIEAWTDYKPPAHPWLWARVDPEFHGKGIGTWLMGWAEARVMQEWHRVPEDLRITTRCGVHRGVEEAARLFARLGYTRNRSNYFMQIDMDAPPPAPVWPEGITLRPFNPETDTEAVYQAVLDSFRDHFGFEELPYEEGLERFRRFEMGYEGFDPSLFFIAMDGDQVAGVSLCPPCSISDPSLGWVGDLGVRRSWRKRGLGLALLLHSFGEFHRRGLRKVGLSVDASSLTGAVRLYEKAGMHVMEVFDHYEKEWRPGREIRVESLES